MNREDPIPNRKDQAVAWFLRLQNCDDEEVWIAHRDWLEADVANVATYAAVERTWLDTEALPAFPDEDAVVVPDPTENEERGTVIDLMERRTALGRRKMLVWVPAAAAAALLAMVASPRIGGLFEASGTTYRTDASGGREVALADGSVMTLNRDTEATVHMDGDGRAVVIASGQAAFDVRHDPARPFTVAAADREVRVLGTEFDVLARDGAFGVSVRRGVVSVSEPNASGEPLKLRAGKALIRLAGSDRDRISQVDPENALAWKAGQLTYLDSDLNTVARDYERYVGKPVVVAPEVANLHISGVVKARDEDDLIHQLEQLLPVRIERTATGREIRKK